MTLSLVAVWIDPAFLQSGVLLAFSLHPTIMQNNTVDRFSFPSRLQKQDKDDGVARLPGPVFSMLAGLSLAEITTDSSLCVVR